MTPPVSVPWDYTLRFGKSTGYGQTTLAGAYSVNTLISANTSLATAGSVGQASIQVADPNGVLSRTLDLQAFDTVQLRINGRYSPGMKRVIWTGYIDQVGPRWDTTNGNSLVIDASTAMKQWEITSLQLAPGINDAASFALAYLQGIGARDLIRLTATKVQYPGPLASSPYPAQLLLYAGPEIVGQRNFNLPDGVFTQPDLQKYAPILTGLSNDTGLQIYFDEYSNCVVQPVSAYQYVPAYTNYQNIPSYLTFPTAPLAITDADILEAVLARTDQNVASQVRVRWAYDYVYSSDGVATAPGTLAAQLGTRIVTIQQPWIQSLDTAAFLARALMQMYSANVGIGSITIPADPRFRLGHVITVPGLVPGSTYGLFQVVGIVHNLEWNGAFTTTLQLAYGRDPAQSFPYVGTQSTPMLSASLSKAGVPQGAGGLTILSTGQLSTPFTLSSNSTLKPGQVIAPSGIPIGSTIEIDTPDGTPVGGSTNNGLYVVVGNNDSTNELDVQNAGTVKNVSTTIIIYGSGPDQGTSTTQSSTDPAPTTPVAPTTDGSALPTPGAFLYWPINFSGAPNISQPFGPTAFTGEFPYTYNGPTTRVATHGQYYPLFHTGIDLPCPAGTPLYAPTGGVVTFAGWDTSGFGNLIILQCGPDLSLYFGHLQSFNCTVGDSVTVSGSTRPVLGYADSTGNSTGSHLHFGVYSATWASFIDPLPLLRNAQH